MSTHKFNVLIPLASPKCSGDRKNMYIHSLKVGSSAWFQNISYICELERKLCFQIVEMRSRYPDTPAGCLFRLHYYHSRQNTIYIWKKHPEGCLNSKKRRRERSGVSPFARIPPPKCWYKYMKISWEKQDHCRDCQESTQHNLQNYRPRLLQLLFLFISEIVVDRLCYQASVC